MEDMEYENLMSGDLIVPTNKEEILTSLRWKTASMGGYDTCSRKFDASALPHLIADCFIPTSKESFKIVDLEKGPSSEINDW